MGSPSAGGLSRHSGWEKGVRSFFEGDAGGVLSLFPFRFEVRLRQFEVALASVWDNKSEESAIIWAS